MMKFGKSNESLTTGLIRYLSLFVFVVLAIRLANRFGTYLISAIRTIEYPFGLEYGEGIVWQQAVLISGEKAYGDINTYPFIVFHYPPVYHLAVRSIVSTGLGYLEAGRALSIFSTLVIASIVFLLTFQGLRETTTKKIRFFAAGCAAGTVFTYTPVILWSMLMRVDMLALALSFSGVYLTVRSVNNNRLIYWAIPFFVLAIYTKQTSIAAPFASLCVLFLVRPKQTLKAISLGLAIGLATLIYLIWETHGGFLRHILFYNLNRFSLKEAAVKTIDIVEKNWIYLFTVVLFLIFAWSRVWLLSYKLNNPKTIRSHIENSDFFLLLMLFTIYLVITSLMLVMVGKSGSTINYFIEWMCVWSVIIGLIIGYALHWVTQEKLYKPSLLKQLSGFGIGVLLLYQVQLTPKISGPYWDTETFRQMENLVEQIQKARKPVLSANMTLVMQAGKDVPMEPAIFIELAQKGLWDQQQIIDLIQSKSFEFVLLSGSCYPGCFTKSVRQAIEKNYTRLVHYPIANSILLFPIE